MLQLRLQAMLCTVCLHAHDIMQDLFICVFFYVSEWSNSFRFYVSHLDMCYTKTVFYYYSSLAYFSTLCIWCHYERNEILSWIGHSSACHWYQRAASFSLYNTDWASFTIQPSNNSAMFIHVETRCFPLRRNMQQPAQSKKTWTLFVGNSLSCVRCGENWSCKNKFTGTRVNHIFSLPVNGRCIIK